MKNEKINYSESIRYLNISKKYISGASTFSKLNHFGEGKTPFAVTKGDGAYVWDVDGNRYIDYVSSRGFNILGFNNKSVNSAIENQLNKGINFSLPHYLEIEVAEMLCNLFPSAEMVRFGKNGNDVTAAAVRLARFFTKRDHILYCGYHGWQDWYIIKTSMNGGIPKAIGDFTHGFPYNDLDSLKELFGKYSDNIAAVIMEPTRFVEPSCYEDNCTQTTETVCQYNFLHKVKELTEKNGSILIFDEMVTGFRFSNTGAQGFFNVKPDLTCIGKALTNGLPLSAVFGSKKIMIKFTEIFFSLTSAGETLSLASAKAVLELIKNINVAEQLNNVGGKLLNGLDGLISKHGLDDVMVTMGYPCYNRYFFKDNDAFKLDSLQLMDFWTQEIAKRGILSCETHIMNYSHTNEMVEQTLNIYDDVLNLIKAKRK